MGTSRQRRRAVQGWSIPLIYVVFTVAASAILPRVEHHFTPDWVAPISVQSAIAIAASIASRLIALTGIVFLLVFVMVQFSATASSPRLVIWVSRTPVMAHSLGVFTSTFFYALTTLAWVDRNSEGHVPLISGWLMFALL